MYVIMYDYLDNNKIYHKDNRFSFQVAEDANNAWKNLKELEKEQKVYNIRTLVETENGVVAAEKKYSVAFVRFNDFGREYSYKAVAPVKPTKNAFNEDEYLVLTRNGVRRVPVSNIRFVKLSKKELKYPYDKMIELVNIKFHRSNFDYTVHVYQFEKNGTYAAHVESCWEHLTNEFGDVIPEKMITTPYFKTWKEALSTAERMVKEAGIPIV